MNGINNGVIEAIQRNAFRKSELKENDESWSTSTPSPHGPENGDSSAADALWKAEVVVRNLRQVDLTNYYSHFDSLGLFSDEIFFYRNES